VIRAASGSASSRALERSDRAKVPSCTCVRSARLASLLACSSSRVTLMRLAGVAISINYTIQHDTCNTYIRPDLDQISGEGNQAPIAMAVAPNLVPTTANFGAPPTLGTRVLLGRVVVPTTQNGSRYSTLDPASDDPVETHVRLGRSYIRTFPLWQRYLRCARAHVACRRNAQHSTEHSQRQKRSPAECCCENPSCIPPHAPRDYSQPATPMGREGLEPSTDGL
jgi:hypothetical protein